MNTEATDTGFCGTSGCLAGHVAVSVLGYKPFALTLDQQVVLSMRNDAGQFVSLGPVFIGPDAATTRVGIPHIQHVVGGYLGLSLAEQDFLFDPDNGLSDLKEMVENFCSESSRSEESKQRLRDAIDLVLAADAAGTWDQKIWFRP